MGKLFAIFKLTLSLNVVDRIVIDICKDKDESSCVPFSNENRAGLIVIIELASPKEFESQAPIQQQRIKTPTL